MKRLKSLNYYCVFFAPLNSFWCYCDEVLWFCNEYCDEKLEVFEWLDGGMLCVHKKKLINKFVDSSLGSILKCQNMKAFFNENSNQIEPQIAQPSLVITVSELIPNVPILICQFQPIKLSIIF